jgi:hypothetical protein
LGDSTSVDPHVVRRSLRKAGNEPQFTRLLGALAQGDPNFCTGLLGLLVRVAPHPREALGRFDPNAKTSCRVEQPLLDQGELLGYVDLVLAQPNLSLFIEVKLYSDYGPQQLPRYLRGIDPAAGEMLISVTRNVSRYREPPDDAMGWLGSLRWAGLLTALCDLPTQGPVQEQWRLLLEVLEDDGDLGSAGLSPEDVIAYERSEEACARLTDILEQIGIGALHRLRAELSAGNPEVRSAARFSPRRRRKSSPARRVEELDEDFPEVIADGEELYLAFEVPAHGPERLWIGFYIESGTAWFYIGTGWWEEEDPPASWTAEWLAASVRWEREVHGGRPSANEGGEPYCHVDYRLSDFTRHADVPGALAGVVDREIPVFVRSGLFQLDAIRPLRRS